jgi:cytochrome c553
MNKIVLSSALALFLIGCGDANKSEHTQKVAEVTKEKAALAKAEVSEVKAAVKDAVAQKMASTEEVVTQTKESIAETKELATKEVAEAKTAVTKALDTAGDIPSKAKEELNKTKEAATAAVTAAAAEVEAPEVEKVPQALTAVAASVDGKKLFGSCAGCHGAKAERKALGKSQVIQNWDAAKIEAALKGYKDGSYGGAMKATMQVQAKKLSDADIKAIAEYITTLK